MSWLTMLFWKTWSVPPFLCVAHVKNLMIYGYYQLICTHQSVYINRIIENETALTTATTVSRITKKELSISTYSRDFIFSRDSLLELVTQIKFVTRSVQISCSKKYLIAFNIDFSVGVITSCFEARCKFTVFKPKSRNWNNSEGIPVQDEVRQSHLQIGQLQNN